VHLHNQTLAFATHTCAVDVSSNAKRASTYLAYWRTTARNSATGLNEAELEACPVCYLCWEQRMGESSSSGENNEILAAEDDLTHAEGTVGDHRSGRAGGGDQAVADSLVDSANEELSGFVAMEP
jgi:hypothetical protein